MARINLLTIHYGENKGSFLQTWATKKILESLGHKVVIIDLEDYAWSARSRLNRPGAFLKLPCMLQFKLLRKKYLSPMTPYMESLRENLIPDADYFVVGSDQVWNPDITKGNALAYFGDFVSTDCPRIALSSSFGITEWTADEKLTLKIRSELQKFSAISVREGSAVDICRDIFGVPAEQVCDPTIAWNQYTELADCRKHYHEIYAFFLFDDPLFKKIASDVCQSLHLPLRISNKTILHKRSHRPNLVRKSKTGTLSGMIDVETFLKRIGGSDFVVTNSFHGTVFCLLYEKNFIVFPPEHANRIARMRDLLATVGLEQRLCYNEQDYYERKKELLSAIDYCKVRVKIAEQRAKFFDFVRNNIQ